MPKQQRRESKNERVVFLVTPTQRAELDQEAQERDLSMGQVIRERLFGEGKRKDQS